MKRSRSIPIILLPVTGALLLAGCDQKSENSATSQTQLSANSNSVSEEISNPPPANVNVNSDTNTIQPAEPITNPPPAATLDTEGKAQIISSPQNNSPQSSAPENSATTAPESPEPHLHQIYSENSNASAPTNFFNGEATAQQNYYLRLRVGYDHGSRDDNNNTVFAGVKFYAHNDNLRVSAGKNAWLVPDADLEFSHEVLAKPDGAHIGSDDGIKLRGTLFWPWIHGTVVCGPTNSSCPMFRPHALAFGPTANFGFEDDFDGNGVRAASYGGIRMTIKGDSFIEYTFGDTVGLSGTRQQIAAELPFYESRDGQIRFMFRGLFNTGANSSPDFFQAGVFAEMPVGVLMSPSKWRDLMPFAK